MSCFSLIWMWAFPARFWVMRSPNKKLIDFAIKSSFTRYQRFDWFVGVYFEWLVRVYNAPISIRKDCRYSVKPGSYSTPCMFRYLWLYPLACPYSSRLLSCFRIRQWTHLLSFTSWRLWILLHITDHSILLFSPMQIHIQKARSYTKCEEPEQLFTDTDTEESFKYIYTVIDNEEPSHISLLENQDDNAYENEYSWDEFACIST